MVWKLLLITSLSVCLSGCLTTGYIKNTITVFPDGTTVAECEARYFGTKDSTSAQLVACGGGVQVEGSITSDLMLKLLKQALDARYGMITPL